MTLRFTKGRRWRTEESRVRARVWTETDGRAKQIKHTWKLKDFDTVFGSQLTTTDIISTKSHVKDTGQIIRAFRPSIDASIDASAEFRTGFYLTCSSSWMTESVGDLCYAVHSYAPRACSAPRKRRCSRARLMQPRAWVAPVSGVRGPRCAPFAACACRWVLAMSSKLNSGARAFQQVEYCFWVLPSLRVHLQACQYLYKYKYLFVILVH